MVATQTALGMAGAILTEKVATLFTVGSKPEQDQLLKAGLGLGLILLSVPVKDGFGKTAMLAIGIGLLGAAAAPYLAQLTR